MFIELLQSRRLFAPAERDILFDLLIYQYIALRWSAQHWLAAKSINIWLRWSQNIVWYCLAMSVPMIELT